MGWFTITAWRYWLAGLWDADRGSTAKGVVSIKNKDYNLLAGFVIVSISEFGVSPSKFRARVTVGYSRAIDIYYTSMKVRRILEEIVRSKEDLTGVNATAFIAGKIDGDGYVNPVKREIIIGYSERKLDDALRDGRILDNIGVEYRITRGNGVVRLRIHKPRSVAEILYPYILHSEKSKRVAKLLM